MQWLHASWGVGITTGDYHDVRADGPEHVAVRVSSRGRFSDHAGSLLRADAVHVETRTTPAGARTEKNDRLQDAAGRDAATIAVC